ncbi:hypothetical protein [Candidatus Neptunochlamydia vexilliferae]|uniref:Uncharacterized protein n=1 Tax=Candidatus Neptunichlamydia vexilliferae TaxID=1651774 RepID=A0ABS0B0P8_9BACT|nr:hypothetical protein [Candidatus Neptunochlamydia vexilliferae]MBF5059140.1 hypothetical protein [Candidatus Neptunochlamydia vexilliferae]
MPLSLYEKALANSADPTSPQSVYEQFSLLYQVEPEGSSKWLGRKAMALPTALFNLTFMPIWRVAAGVVMVAVGILSLDPLVMFQELARETHGFANDVEDALISLSNFFIGDCRSFFLAQQLEHQRQDQARLIERQQTYQDRLNEQLNVENQPALPPPPPPIAAPPPPPVLIFKKLVIRRGKKVPGKAPATGSSSRGGIDMNEILRRRREMRQKKTSKPPVNQSEKNNIENQLGNTIASTMYERRKSFGPTPQKDQASSSSRRGLKPKSLDFRDKEFERLCKDIKDSALQAMGYINKQKEEAQPELAEILLGYCIKKGLYKRIKTQQVVKHTSKQSEVFKSYVSFCIEKGDVKWATELIEMFKEPKLKFGYTIQLKDYCSKKGKDFPTNLEKFKKIDPKFEDLSKESLDKAENFILECQDPYQKVVLANRFMDKCLEKSDYFLNEQILPFIWEKGQPFKRYIDACIDKGFTGQAAWLIKALPVKERAEYSTRLIMVCVEKGEPLKDAFIEAVKEQEDGEKLLQPHLKKLIDRFIKEKSHLPEASQLLKWLTDKNLQKTYIECLFKVLPESASFLPDALISLIENNEDRDALLKPYIKGCEKAKEWKELGKIIGLLVDEKLRDEKYNCHIKKVKTEDDLQKVCDLGKGIMYVGRRIQCVEAILKAWIQIDTHLPRGFKELLIKIDPKRNKTLATYLDQCIKNSKVEKAKTIAGLLEGEQNRKKALERISKPNNNAASSSSHN